MEKEIPRVESPWSPPGSSNKPATDDAAPEQTEDRPKRTRSRGGRGRNKSERPAEDAAAPTATPEVQQADNAPVEQPAPKRDNAGGGAGGGRSRGGRGRSGVQDNRVVGLGDHLPGFIALSFEERREENAG